MEMMILSILGPQLHCEWRLPSYEVALITSVKIFWVLCKNCRCVICAKICIQVFFLVFFFFTSGGLHWYGVKFACMGECVGQVRQKSSEYHIWLSCGWVNYSCALPHTFSVYVSVLTGSDYLYVLDPFLRPVECLLSSLRLALVPAGPRRLWHWWSSSVVSFLHPSYTIRYVTDSLMTIKTGSLSF